jgi:hypothetical protein
VVSSALFSAAAELRRALAGFEPGLFSGDDCARLAEELAATEKACAGARVLASGRAVASGAFRHRGYTDAPAWLARQAGTTGSHARQALETARSLERLPETRMALLAGSISLAQATEIIQAESETPGAEAELLPVAQASDLSSLREQAREHRQAHTDPADLRRRQLAAREFRHWRDRLGMVRFTGALPPESGLPLIQRIEVAALRARRAARAAGEEPPSFQALAADALAGLIPGGDGSGTSAVRADLVLVCDLFAWRRGHTHPGEICQIIGGGAIPVDVAKEYAGDAFVKAVLHDGVNIHTVKHFGRHLPAAVRTALDLGPVPRFTGRACVDCGRRWGLEYDHVNPVANQGPTEYANLEARCWPDHQAKTERDRRAGLLGPHARPAPGSRRPPTPAQRR